MKRLDGLVLNLSWRSWSCERNKWSGRRDSNPRPTAWKAVTLPLSYSRWASIKKTWWRREDSNLRRAKPGRFTVCCHCPLGHTSKELPRAGPGLEPAPGFEPGTYGLQDRSSTPELCRRAETRRPQLHRVTP